MKYFVILLGLCCLAASPGAAGFDDLLPKPSKVEPGAGDFSLPEMVNIHVQPLRMMDAARQLAEQLESFDKRITCPVGNSADAPGPGGILIISPEDSSDAATNLGSEGYQLRLAPECITIIARQSAGVFYAGQTLAQLLQRDPAGGGPRLPQGVVTDAPRFGWRGLMLDCSRTFLPMAYLKRYVDLLALHKMNTLHLHLTDDQGWRMEIRRHPKLTEIGAQWDPACPNEQGGFYTQAELKDLVAYAQARFVMVVPEIEMPSHCLAALKAHPELSCRGDDYRIVPFMEMLKPGTTPYGVFCAGNDATFALLEDVLAEVIEVFPAPYIHIGGDECPKEYWAGCPKCKARKEAEGLRDDGELQSYFVRRIERFINAKGRTLLGWDEILEGGLAPNAAVMSWRGVEGGIAAAKADHPVVMSPTSHCYFDYDYAVTPTEKVYRFSPVPAALDPDKGQYILGAQANMWTHIARTEPAIDAMIWPRLAALAEAVWTPREAQNAADFNRRLTRHQERLDALGVTLHPDPLFPAMAVAPDGVVWLALRDAVHCWTNGQWSEFPGTGLKSLALSTTGERWAVGGPTGDRLLRWNGQDWQEAGAPNGVRQVTFTNLGQLLVTSQDLRWRLLVEGAFQEQPGVVRWVVDGGGKQYALGDTSLDGGYAVLAWDGAAWQSAGAGTAAIGLAAAKDGTLWAVNGLGAVWHFTNGQWQGWPLSARAVAAGGSNAVYAVSTDAMETSWQLLRFVDNAWQPAGTPLILSPQPSSPDTVNN